MCVCVCLNVCIYIYIYIYFFFYSNIQQMFLKHKTFSEHEYALKKKINI